MNFQHFPFQLSHFQLFEAKDLNFNALYLLNYENRLMRIKKNLHCNEKKFLVNVDHPSVDEMKDR